MESITELSVNIPIWCRITHAHIVSTGPSSFLLSFLVTYRFLSGIESWSSSYSSFCSIPATLSPFWCNHCCAARFSSIDSIEAFLVWPFISSCSISCAAQNRYWELAVYCRKSRSLGSETRERTNKVGAIVRGKKSQLEITNAENPIGLSKEEKEMRENSRMK